MRMTRRLTMMALTTLALAALGPAAQASGGNPHWVRGSGAINDAGNLVVNFKAAGLDGNQGITITASANAQAIYACKNHGGNFPQDPKKQEVTGTVSRSGDFWSDQNGNVTGSLTLTPPPSTSALACRDDQIPVLAKVTYSQVQVSSQNLGDLPISGTYSKVLEPNCKCL